MASTSLLTLYLVCVPGVWVDYWKWTVDPSDTLSRVCMFLVDNQYYIQSFGPQLHPNNIVEITLDAGIQGIDWLLQLQVQYDSLF